MRGVYVGRLGYDVDMRVSREETGVGCLADEINTRGVALFIFLTRRAVNRERARVSSIR